MSDNGGAQNSRCSSSNMRTIALIFVITPYHIIATLHSLCYTEKKLFNKFYGTNQESRIQAITEQIL